MAHSISSPTPLFSAASKKKSQASPNLQPQPITGNYSEFLTTFLERGYRFCFFSDLNEPFLQIALRHDIDFDTHFALRIAEQEKALGIRSTFFFLLRSPMYNPFQPENAENILRIKELGHAVSIHFDPSIYLDFEEGLRKEVEIFHVLARTEVSIVSLHRPSLFFQQHDTPIAGIEHTYQSKYFRDIQYLSDSTGVWRYGHPFQTAAFAEGRTIHLLIHPIWWVLDGATNTDKLRQYYRQRVDVLKADFSENCIPFQQLHGYL